MIFLDRSVVIEDGQLGAGLDVEVVGGAGVVVVVDDGGQEDAEYLQVRQPGLHRSHTWLSSESREDFLLP